MNRKAEGISRRQSLSVIGGAATGVMAAGYLGGGTANATSWPIDPATPAGVQPVADTGGTRTLIFSDEFDASSLDTSKWTVRDEPRTDGNNGVTWSYASSNVRMTSGSALAIDISQLGTNDYAGGRIDSQGKWAYTYGVIEYSVHVPPTQGHLAAVWLQAENGLSDTAPSAAEGAEIDIMESFAQDNQYGANIHYDGYGPNEKSTGSTITAAGLHDGTWYHTLCLEWWSNELKFFYDGTLAYTVTDSTWIPTVSEFPIISHEIIAYAQGDIHNAPLDTTSTMYVDYVRAWQ